MPLESTEAKAMPFIRLPKDGGQEELTNQLLHPKNWEQVVTYDDACKAADDALASPSPNLHFRALVKKMKHNALITGRRYGLCGVDNGPYDSDPSVIVHQSCNHLIVMEDGVAWHNPLWRDYYYGTRNFLSSLRTALSVIGYFDCFSQDWPDVQLMEVAARECRDLINVVQRMRRQGRQQ